MSQTIYRTDREYRVYRRKLMRQRELRRNIIITVVSTMTVIILALFFYSITSSAHSEIDAVSYKYFKSIQVEKGDSLWNIAEKYSDEDHYKSKREYISEVMVMNKLSSDEILAGQYLVIPYYSYEFIQ